MLRDRPDDTGLAALDDGVFDIEPPSRWSTLRLSVSAPLTGFTVPGLANDLEKGSEEDDFFERTVGLEADGATPLSPMDDMTEFRKLMMSLTSLSGSLGRLGRRADNKHDSGLLAQKSLLVLHRIGCSSSWSRWIDLRRVLW